MEQSSQLTFTPSFFRGVGLNHQPDSANTFHKNTESSWTKLDESGCRRSSDWRPCPRKVRPPWNWGSSQGVPIGFLVGLLESIPILHDVSLMIYYVGFGYTPKDLQHRFFQIFFKEAFSRGRNVFGSWRAVWTDNKFVSWYSQISWVNTRFWGKTS